MPKLTKEALDKVEIPAFVSPVDGEIYTVTAAAIIVANIRDMLKSGLRQTAPSVYAEAVKVEVEAIRSGKLEDVRKSFTTLVQKVAQQVPEDKAEHPLIRQGRHMLTDVLGVLSPEHHAEYRAVKYAGAAPAEGEAPQKADHAKRVEALVFAASIIAKAALVPGF